MIYYFLIFLLNIGIIFFLNNYFSNSIIFDNNYDKPQSAHSKKTLKIGGFLILLNLIFLTYLLNISLELSFYFILSLFLILGFLGDFNFKPLVRLILMVMAIILTLFLLPLSIEKITFIIFDINFNYNKVILFIFTFLCILVVINGINFIDSNNGNIILFSIIVIFVMYYLNNDSFLNLILLLFLQLFILILLLNFPNSYTFMGDNGSIIIGFILSYLAISFNNLNTDQDYHSAIVVILLIYPAFEVFFSIIRKYIEGTNPMKADGLHLHNILFKKMSHYFNEYHSNYLTSILINSVILINIIVAILFFIDFSYLILYSLFMIIQYLIFYFILRKII